MGRETRRVLAVVAAALAAFALAVAAGLWLSPEPREQIDYLVIGSVATFLMLGVVFGLALAFWIKPGDLFGKRRPKPPAEPPPAA